MFRPRAAREGGADIRDFLLPPRLRLRRIELCVEGRRQRAVLPRQIGQPIAHRATAFRSSHLVEARRLLAIAQRPLSFGPSRRIVSGVRLPPAVRHNRPLGFPRPPRTRREGIGSRCGDLTRKPKSRFRERFRNDNNSQYLREVGEQQ